MLSTSQPPSELECPKIERDFLHHLGELLPSGLGASGFPGWPSILLSTIVLVIALLQSGESRDDDDSGPGDGGIMQPVGSSA